MIPNFKKFINEELHIQDMDVNSLNTLKRNLLFRLGEYKTYILSNIVYNLETNKIQYNSSMKKYLTLKNLGWVLYPNDPWGIIIRWLLFEI